MEFRIQEDTRMMVELQGAPWRKKQDYPQREMSFQLRLVRKTYQEPNPKEFAAIGPLQDILCWIIHLSDEVIKQKLKEFYSTPLAIKI